MPLIETNVLSILDHVGLRGKTPEKPEDLKDLLRNHNLDTESVLSELSGLVHGGDSDAIKLRAGEMALKMNGVLQDNKGVSAPVVNFIFNGEHEFTVNPILIPRL